MKFLRLLLLMLAGVAPAAAQDVVSETFAGLEVRGGAAISGIELIRGTAVLPDLGTFSLANLDSFQADIIWTPPDNKVLNWIGNPRLALGGVVNLRGRESLIHAGFNWHVPLGEVFYLELGGGMGTHNGALVNAAPPARNLGCPLLFHWSAGVGANLGERVTVTAGLQHMSNAIFCYPNDGLNHYGVTVGWKF